MNQNLSSYGQHYLVDSAVLNCLIDTASIGKSDRVLEIGAGEGIVTKELAKKAQSVVSYEIDDKTKKQLDFIADSMKNVRIIYQNILEVDLAEIQDNYDIIVASLPYQITEPFVELLHKLHFKNCTLIVGNNFAQNACTHEYTNKLSLFTDCFFYTEFIRIVDSTAFSPPPKTASAIISIIHKQKEDLLDVPALYVMRELFEQRDKKVKNALREALINYFAAISQTLTKRESVSLLSDTLTCIRSEIMIEQLQNAELVSLYCSIKRMFESMGGQNG